MDNGIKRQLSDVDLANLVQRAFDGDRILNSALELKDGWFNSAYVLTMEDGMKAVLKVAPRQDGGTLTISSGHQNI